MSRVVHSLLGLVLLSAPLVPVMAQSAPPPIPSLPVAPDDDTSNDVSTLGERLLVAPREPQCDDNGQVGGITVCGKKKDNSKDRVQALSDLNSGAATADGLPRAPDVMGNRITGHSIKFGCLPGTCPRAMLPDINFSLLPPDPIGRGPHRQGRNSRKLNSAVARVCQPQIPSPRA